MENEPRGAWVSDLMFDIVDSTLYHSFSVVSRSRERARGPYV